jgi:hypothetical protein
MFRTQIQLTEEQSRALKQLAAREGISVSELIRTSVDVLLRSSGFINPEERRKKALDAVGRLHNGPKDLSTNHDRYLTEVFET